jgi:hypothetical protein
MRRILLSVMLALTLAGGLMTFIASNVAQAHPDNPHCEGEPKGDTC